MLADHRKSAAKNIMCAVITVSDTRVKATDKSGRKVISLLHEANHFVHIHKIVPDHQRQIQEIVEEMIHHDQVEAIIFNGGTGISKRDITIESIEPLLDKQLPGFGELFRYLSYTCDIGTASMLSRALCGVANHRLIFSIPGSTGAVTLAMERLILPEIGHMLREIHKEV